MVKVLVAFGSRYGSTSEIAHAISTHLNNQDIETQLLNLKEIKQKNWPSLKNFDGILIGSGIKIGAWTKEAKKFLKQIRSDNITSPIGAFVSCGEAGDPDKQSEAKKKYIEKVLAKFGVKATLHDAFGGVLDLTEASNLGGLNKKMLSLASKEDPTIKQGEKNDGRDWAQIEKFAINFCNLLKN